MRLQVARNLPAKPTWQYSHETGCLESYKKRPSNCCKLFFYCGAGSVVDPVSGSRAPWSRRRNKYLRLRTNSRKNPGDLRSFSQWDTCRLTPDVNQCVESKGWQAVLRIRIRDPMPFWPLDPGSGIDFFRIPDPNPYFWELCDNFWGKKLNNSLKIGPNFFLQHFKTKIIFDFVKFVAT